MSKSSANTHRAAPGLEPRGGRTAGASGRAASGGKRADHSISTNDASSSVVDRSGQISPVSTQSLTPPPPTQTPFSGTESRGPQASRGRPSGRGGNARRGGSTASAGERVPDKLRQQFSAAAMALTAANAPDTEIDSESLCLVCCELAPFRAVGECGHRSCCSTCALRIRTLHRDDRCVLCKAKQTTVFVLPEHEKRSHADFASKLWGASSAVTSGLYLDEASGMYFSSQAHLNEMITLREARCAKCPEQKFPSRAQLEKHLGAAHGEYLCQLCGEHRGLFVSEMRRMTRQQLQQHIKSGDGASTGFTGHPSCKFCTSPTQLTFYNNDALYKHLNERHEACHLCARSGVRYQYFRDYNQLEAHFGDAHFVCRDARCVEKRFVAFEDELQYKAHVAAEHPELLPTSTDRTINIDFVVRGSRREGEMRRQGIIDDDDLEYSSRSGGASSSSSSRAAASSSAAAAPASSSTTVMGLQDFPSLQSLHGALPSSSAHASAEVRRYASATSGGSSRLSFLTKADEVSIGVARRSYLAGEVTAPDFVAQIDALVGPVAANIVFPQIFTQIATVNYPKAEELRAAHATWSSAKTAKPASAAVLSSRRGGGRSSDPSWGVVSSSNTVESSSRSNVPAAGLPTGLEAFPALPVRAPTPEDSFKKLNVNERWDRIMAKKGKGATLPRGTTRPVDAPTGARLQGDEDEDELSLGTSKKSKRKPGGKNKSLSQMAMTFQR